MRLIRRHYAAVFAGVTISALVCLLAASIPAAAAVPTGGKLVEIPDVYKWPAGTTPQMVDTAKYKKPGPYKIGFSNCSTTNAWAVLFWETAKWEAAKYPQQ
ncbi:MAG: hypothetical protein ABSH20_29955, partial [Tepidisphaeraceae bacterium]